MISNCDRLTFLICIHRLSVQYAMAFWHKPICEATITIHDYIYHLWYRNCYCEFNEPFHPISCIASANKVTCAHLLSIVDALFHYFLARGISANLSAPHLMALPTLLCGINFPNGESCLTMFMCVVTFRVGFFFLDL